MPSLGNDVKYFTHKGDLIMKVRFIYTKQVEVKKEVSDDFILLLDKDTMCSRMSSYSPIQSDEIHPQSDPSSSIWQMSPPDPLRNIQHLSYFCLKTSGNGHFSANSGWAESNLLHAHLSSLSHEQRSAN